MKFTLVTARSTRFLVGLISIATLVTVAAIAGQSRAHRASAAEEPRSKNSPVQFDESGQLLRPKGYRKWIYVGTPLTPNDMNAGHAAFPEFHSVYVDPVSFEHFEETGEFKDGTVVIKELIRVGGKQASSGRGYFMGEFNGLEVAIKDKTRFHNQPGGWAYFSFGHEYPLAPRAAAQPVANCSVCHGANADTDYVFTQFYPVLRAAVPSKESL